MDGVLDSMAEAEAAGCKPHINPLKKAQAQARKRERNGLPPLSTGGSRSDYEIPFHVGVFKHPSRVFTQPWITRDTLQGLSGDGRLREVRMGKMMALCRSLDNLVNGRVQRLLSRISPKVLLQFRDFARLRASSKEVAQHDMRQHPLPAHLERFDTRWPFLRFGNLGTTVAIGRGQSEKLHLDVHDDEELPTTSWSWVVKIKIGITPKVRATSCYRPWASPSRSIQAISSSSTPPFSRIRSNFYLTKNVTRGQSQPSSLAPPHGSILSPSVVYLPVMRIL